VPGRVVCCTKSGRCTCAVQAGTNVTVLGTGGAEDPYVVSSITAASADAGNIARMGSDGRIYVPAPVINDSSTVDFSGTASATTPLTAVVKLATDTGNIMAINAGGLYAPNVATQLAQTANCNAVADCVGTHLSNGLTYNSSTRLLSARLSGNTGNMLTFGTDNGIMAKPVDTGWINNATTAWLTWAPNWTTGAGTATQARRINTVVSLVVNAMRSGANLTPTTQDIPDELVLTITDSRFLPSQPYYGMFQSGSQMAGYVLATNGQLTIMTLTTQLVTNQTLQTTPSFPGN